ncbi:MAG: PRC-barrel domain-containing protein [Candidatus Woesearchaeota archaeon]
MSQTLTSDDILGKDAVDKEGDILGVIIKLHITKSQKALTGITIDQGFMKPNLFVGIEYVRNFGVDTVFLNYVPRTKCKGMRVITAEGKNIGVVIDVKMKRGKLQAITVARNKLAKRKKKMIPASDIKEISTQILLKKEAQVNDVETK